MKADKTLDVRAFMCPMPIIKTKKAIEQMEPGQVLEILASDPGAKEDFPAWCKQTGHELLEIIEGGDVIKIYIRKK